MTHFGNQEVIVLFIERISMSFRFRLTARMLRIRNKRKTCLQRRKTRWLFSSADVYIKFVFIFIITIFKLDKTKW